MPFLAPKYGLVDSEALLGRFAKYTWMQMYTEWHYSETLQTQDLSRQTSEDTYTTHNETFRFVDTTHLLESETRCFCIPFSKDWIFADETILFER